MGTNLSGEEYIIWPPNSDRLKNKCVTNPPVPICSAGSDRKSVDSIFGVTQPKPASTVHYQTFSNLQPSLHLSRGVASGGSGGSGRGGRSPPKFVSSVNPIPTRGTDYAHHITTCPPPTEFETYLHLCLASEDGAVVAS